MLAYGICFSLSDLLHSVWQTLGPSTSLQITQFLATPLLNEMLGDPHSHQATEFPRNLAWGSRGGRSWRGELGLGLAFWGAEGENSMLKEGQSRIKSKCRWFHCGWENNSFLAREWKPLPPEAVGPRLPAAGKAPAPPQQAGLPDPVFASLSPGIYAERAAEQETIRDQIKPIQGQTDALFLKVFRVT